MIDLRYAVQQGGQYFERLHVIQADQQGDRLTGRLLHEEAGVLIYQVDLVLFQIRSSNNADAEKGNIMIMLLTQLCKTSMALLHMFFLM